MHLAPIPRATDTTTLEAVASGDREADMLLDQVSAIKKH